jgi:acyl-CoA reductase-like NAD-dependent aldehyde dehydrogenase
MKMLIDSQWVEAANGQYFEVYNPATGAIVDRVPQATIEDAQLQWMPRSAARRT